MSSSQSIWLMCSKKYHPHDGIPKKLKRRSEKIRDIIEKKICWLLAGTLIAELLALIVLIITLIIINVI